MYKLETARDTNVELKMQQRLLDFLHGKECTDILCFWKTDPYEHWEVLMIVDAIPYVIDYSHRYDPFDKYYDEIISLPKLESYNNNVYTSDYDKISNNFFKKHLHKNMKVRHRLVVEYDDGTLVAYNTKTIIKTRIEQRQGQSTIQRFLKQKYITLYNEL